ncbi:uncharacterized protein FTJAE_4896 [Fusarium tjaetaba]|uniref:Uncharacterized protein n=1 Tax=Fusarium tjaetaba TaxID=1567544 RepID=A0A8H5VZ64_9HYPO|nr:uncharacterized protein FTJAE_4896 [Fusarium tjaetaba]KAF5639558.1 hypothetical protein FTJAE_4896 [Fusarium tjaetaba]
MLISHPQQSPQKLGFGVDQLPGLKMSSAQGLIKSSQPGKFTATFNIDGNLYLFAGNVNPPTQPFENSAATLEYNSSESLEGSQQFTGIIGSRNEVAFTFNDGTAIKGPLDIPVNPAAQVSESEGKAFDNADRTRSTQDVSSTPNFFQQASAQSFKQSPAASKPGDFHLGKGNDLRLVAS